MRGSAQNERKTCRYKIFLSKSVKKKGNSKRKYSAAAPFFNSSPVSACCSHFLMKDAPTAETGSFSLRIALRTHVEIVLFTKLHGWSASPGMHGEHREMLDPSNSSIRRTASGRDMAPFRVSTPHQGGFLPFFSKTAARPPRFGEQYYDIHSKKFFIVTQFMDHKKTPLYSESSVHAHRGCCVPGTQVLPFFQRSDHHYYFFQNYVHSSRYACASGTCSQRKKHARAPGRFRTFLRSTFYIYFQVVKDIFSAIMERQLPCCRRSFPLQREREMTALSAC